MLMPGEEEPQPMSDYEGEKMGDYLRKTLIHGYDDEYGFDWKEASWYEDGMPLSIAFQFKLR